MVAFVMAYSFTEPPADEFDDSPPPMMVPMADILNHVAKNNAHLSFEKEALKMIAIKPIKKVHQRCKSLYKFFVGLNFCMLLHILL